MKTEHQHSHAKHPHSHTPPNNNLAFAIGILLNLSFVIAEIVYGLLSHSLALLSDAGHNLGDVVGLLLAWYAIYLGNALPTKRRTYGLRRASILAALGNSSILLIAVGGITWEAVKRMLHPEMVVAETVMWVAAVGVLINAGSALLFMAGRKSDLNIKGAFIHLTSDAAVSLGVVFSGLVIRMTHWYWLDPASSILVGLVIVFGTYRLLRESINLALDAVPEGIDPVAVEAYLSQLNGVKSVHDLHIWGMSTTEVALTAHLVMPTQPVDDQFIHEIDHDMKKLFQINHITVQIEHGTHSIACHQEPSHVI